MTTFTITCVSLHDACNVLGVDTQAALDDLHNSEISFGTNTDTLVSMSRFASLLHVPVPAALENLMVSLGC